MEPDVTVEHELKFSLVDPPPAAADVAAMGAGGPFAFVEAGAANHVDTYFDDDHGRLARAGWALRTRRPAAGAGTIVATLKGAGDVAGAEHRRVEVEADMAGDDWPVAVARRLTEHVALWQLQPRLTLAVERTSYRVLHEGRPVAILAFDRVTARSRAVERSAHFDEAEIEALGDTAPATLRAIADLVDGLVRLAPSSVTKLERAAAALELGSSF